MKKYHVVTPDKLYVTIKDILSDYAKEVNKVMDETIAVVAKENRQYIKDQTLAVYATKQFVIHKTNKYQNCFKNQKRADGRRIANTIVSLSHLLEDGHMSANQYGKNYSIHTSEYGTRGKTTKEFKIWEKTEDKVREEFPKLLEENIAKIQ